LCTSRAFVPVLVARVLASAHVAMCIYKDFNKRARLACGKNVS